MNSEHLERSRGDRISTGSNSNFFRIMDLPATIRIKIYRYAFGLRMVHVHGDLSPTGDLHSSFTHSVCHCGPVGHSTHSKHSVAEIWEEGDISSVPSCKYMCRHQRSSQPSAIEEGNLQLNLLRASKTIYEEARGILFHDNIYSFQEPIGFSAFLLNTPEALIRKDFIKKLVVVVSPKTNITHYWNYILGDLYLPNGPMSSPDPHFPALREIQFYLRSSDPPPLFDQGTAWYHPFWVWGFAYLALEDLERVSVVSRDYEVRVGDEIVKVGEQEGREYEEGVREKLLQMWMGGDQDDIELMRTHYEMKTQGVEW